MTGDILVPGCGPGHDVRALAGQTLERNAARVLGFDLSPAAVRLAESYPAAGGEKYRAGDLFNLPPDLIGKFDWVVEHTCFCAIDPARRPDYVSSVHDALKPGGHLLAVFYLNPHDPGEKRDGPPFETNLDELAGLFSHHFDKISENIPNHAYPGREGREIVQLLKKRAGATGAANQPL